MWSRSNEFSVEEGELVKADNAALGGNVRALQRLVTARSLQSL